MGRAAAVSLRIPLGRELGTLSARQRERQHRSGLVAGVGDEGLARLAAARVLVVGAGGLGSPALLYLAAAGVGTLGISDADAVESSNLQRQVIHDESSVGVAKTASAAARVRALNADVEVVEHPAMTESLLDSLAGHYDLICDCTDNFDAKYLLADWCARTSTPLVWATVVGTAFQTSVLWSGAPDGAARTLRDLYPAPPPAGATASSLQVGVLGSVVGQVGSTMATEAIKIITGLGEPLAGRVLVADAARARYDVIPFAARS